MATKWVKAKLVLGLNGCVFAPKTLDQTSSSDIPLITHSPSATTTSDSVSTEPVIRGAGTAHHVTSPSPSANVSSGLINKFSRSSSARSSSSKRVCSICLGAMKAGHGHALFTAECSHTFHFACIASSVRYGNHVCPVCRAKWKEVPFQAPAPAPPDPPHGRPNRVNPVNWVPDDDHTIVFRRLPSVDSAIRQQMPTPLFRITEPTSYDDDEPLDSLGKQDDEAQLSGHAFARQVDIKTYPEFSAMPRSESQQTFTILVHLKAPIAANPTQSCGTSQHPKETNSRAPLDLVTVLDVSGSMAGTKLALLKRAMSFVIQNLGSQDRLSVVAFSSTARRLFHLRKMSESGRQQSLQAVNSLISSGGTNIAEGLRKGAKVIEERKERNPVCGIILLSDGQDTYTISSGAAGIHQSAPDYSSLLPSSMRAGGTGQQIPVHAFGFGADHDSASMHSISETSGGTFSFIEAEDAIQDAFAQCIGGLLSVVVQGLRLSFQSCHSAVSINSIKSGSYASQIQDDGKSASIDVGDLYAEEERDFLVYVTIPEADPATNETLMLKTISSYVDPITKELVNSREEGIKIQRPETVTERIVSIEVDRQRNRQHATEAMAEARTLAEKASFSEAVNVLENCRASLAETLAGRSGDKLMTSLDVELKEMQERMKSRHKYESSGRAYVLSGLSSHSWQRATARGDSTSSTSIIQAYQTPSMVNMLNRSQTFGPAGGRPKPPIRPSRSFPAKR